MKKIVALLTALTLLVAISVATMSASADTVKGDINGDGSVSLTDVILMSRAVAGWDGYEFDTADFNGDGIVNAEDLTIENEILNGTYVESVDATEETEDSDGIIFGFFDED